MDSKEEGESHKDNPSSMSMLHHLSEEAFRAAGEALQNLYYGGAGASDRSGGSSLPQIGSGVHRRSQSEIVAKGFHHSNGFQKLKSHVKRWRWSGSKYREEANFNPEILANQKRQWYQLHPKYLILFKYPPGKNLTVRLKDLASFCFPEGVKAAMLERSPSLSELNELVYGQEHLGRDDLSFIFTLKTADNATLYGVCLHVSEIVQRPPGILGTSYPHSHPSGICSRFLVSAPRCYCLLTRVPFFELHFEMLNSLIAQERLNRISQFVNELTLTGSIPSTPKLDDQMSSNANSPERELFNDWMSCAIPLDGAAAITAAAAGITSDDKIRQLSPKIWDSHSQSPASVTASDASDFFPVRDIDKDGRKNHQNHDNCAFEAPETHDSMERMNWNCESDQHSPHVGTHFSARSHKLERLGSFDSLFSPARSMISEDEDDLFANNETDCGDELLMEWAMENKNDLLQVVCRYHASPIPPRGSEFIFRPLEHLQAIQYIRHSVPSLGFSENCLNCSEPAKVNVKLADAEEALALSVWTTAATCRVLSLESVLALVAGVLLEKQVVVVCPNLGVLSATVLSLVPMIRPFQWQSLLLPVLPRKMIDFLDAPVPYIVGIPHKPEDLNMKTSNLVLVDVLKNQVKMCHLPKLPQYRELVSQLGPIHARLKCESSIARKNPAYRCNEVQADAATRFLNIMWHYLESLCSELKLHTITSVQSNNDRVSLLLKDSFIDSFPNRDQPFIKLFVDTQLFTVLSDAHLSSFESVLHSMASDSNPNLRITIERNPCQSRLDELNIKCWPKWGCSAGKYQLKFDAEETCYLVRGKVKAYPKGSSEFVEFGTGDLVTIPKGMSCTWDVSVAVDKYYKFESTTSSFSSS
ncbi:unnamed protein product [Lupinus luteus]|uniref:UDENN domain-containing protein n=1 Tax=Lupinus luteus TaxID=3873 RepID=A0AAV1Y132_LUPLU